MSFESFMDLRNSSVSSGKELFPHEVLQPAVEVSKVLHDEAICKVVSRDTLSSRGKKLQFSSSSRKPQGPPPKESTGSSSSLQVTPRSSSSKTSSSSHRGRGKKFWRFLASLTAAGGRCSGQALACLDVMQHRRMDGWCPPPRLPSSIPSPSTCVASSRGTLVCCSKITPCIGSPGGGFQDHSPAGTRLLQAPFSRAEGDWRVEDCHQPLVTQWFRDHQEIQDGDGLFRSGVCPLRGLDVFGGPAGRLLPDFCTPRFSTVSPLLHRGWCVPIQSHVLHPVQGSAGLHQSLCSGFRVGTSEGRAPSPLPEQLAGTCGVWGTSSSSSGYASSALLRPRHYGQLVKVWPHPFDSSAIPGDGLRHHPWAGVSVHGSSVTVPGGGHVVSPAPSPSCTHVAVPPHWRHSLRWGSHPHAAPPVANEGSLVSAGWRLNLSDPPVSGVRPGLQLVVPGGQMDRGIPLHILPPCLSLYTDASLSGWGAYLLDFTASGMWPAVETQKHINALEMRAMEPALTSFLPQLVGQSVILMIDNASVVAYLSHQGGTVSRQLCQMASAITVWAERNLIRLEARYILEKQNILADQPSCPDQILPTEWSLLPRVFDRICRVFSHPHLNLFTTRVNNKLPLLLCVPGAGSASMEPRCPASSLGPPRCVRLSFVCSAPVGDHTSHGVGGSSVAPSCSTLASEGVVPGPTWPSHYGTSRAPKSVEPPSPASRPKVPSRPRDPQVSRMEFIQRLVRKAGFSRKVASIVAADFRRSTAALYHSKWSQFLDWCGRLGVDPCATSILVIAGFFLHLCDCS